MPVDLFDLSTFDLTALSDDALATLAADVAVEQYRRAVEQADPDALIEQAFERGFAGNGGVTDPWLVDGILVCPGLMVETNKSGSHDCTFVSVKLPGAEASQWVFDATDLIADDVRHLPGPRRHQRSVTLVAAVEGLEVDVVVSQSRGGQHKMKQVRSYKVTGGQMTHVSTRAQRLSATGHR